MLMATEKPPDTSQIWQARAACLLDQALGQVRDGGDAIPTVGAALAALRIEVGELPADALDFMFPDPTEPTERCICPPGLRARGGFRGSCPVHA